MDLEARAKGLQKLGFFEAGTDLAALVAAAKKSPIDYKSAPATALLLAADKVLEITADSVVDLEDYEPLLKRIQDFCGGVFTISKVRARELERTSEFTDGDEEIPDALMLKFDIDRRPVECELSDFDDLVDLSFLNEIEDHLEGIGEPRRLCPLVELMDDTARYLFIEPEKMDEAELQEYISAPDFEG